MSMWGRFLLKKSTCCMCFMMVPTVILYYYITAPVCGRKHPELCRKYKYKPMIKSPKKLVRLTPTTPKVEPTSFPDRANRLAIYGGYRSGTSYISEFFMRHPDIAYMFEPLSLKRMTEIDNIGPGIIRDILSCDLSTRRVAQIRNRWLETEVFCHFDNQTPGCVPKKGINRTVAAAFCHSRNIRVVKVNRLPHIKQLEKLMRQGMKVVHVVRDQRSLLFSRKRLHTGSWFRIKTAAQEYCQQQVADYYHIKDLIANNSTFQELYHMVRFEDVAMNPSRRMENLYKFIGVHPHESVVKWSQKLGEANRASTGTARMATGENLSSPLDSIYSWRQTAVMASEVHVAQDACGDFMRLFGYRRINYESELNDLEFQLVLPRQFNYLSK